MASHTHSKMPPAYGVAREAALCYTYSQIGRLFWRRHMANRNNLFLAPMPKRIRMREGAFDPEGKMYLRLEAAEPSLLMAAARKTGIDWQITASPKVPKDAVGLTIKLAGDSDIPAEGYNLAITPQRMEIVASDTGGSVLGRVYPGANPAPMRRRIDWSGLQHRGPVRHSMPLDLGLAGSARAWGDAGCKQGQGAYDGDAFPPRGPAL